MDYIKNQFLKNKQVQPWICLRYIDDICFIWAASESKFDEFLEQRNNFHPNLNFRQERCREKISFLDVTVRINQ